LNDGLAAAQAAGCRWLLTVDQDTVMPADYVSTIVEAARLLGLSGVPLGALGAGAVNIAGATMRYPGRTLDYGGLIFSITEEVIQSGTIWNVEAMTAIGGFNEAFGMDAVDAHACLRLREQGLVVAALPQLAIDHRLGSARSLDVGRDRPVFVTGHSPERRASMMRNRLALFPDEFRQSPRHALRTLRRVLVNQAAGLVIEGDAWAKARGSLRGLRPRPKR
jgi:rhamnosyltransferase